VVDLGGAILDLGCHLMGEFEVRSVSAQTFAKFGPRGAGESDWGRSEVDPKRPFTVEDCGMALLRFKSGRSLILETAWAANLPTEQKEFGIELLGVNGGLSLFPARVYRPGTTGFETVELNPPVDPHSDDRLDHFVNAVLDNRKPQLIPAEALKLQRIVDAIYASAKQGREVRLT
jgi:predicted dehydrogenase